MAEGLEMMRVRLEGLLRDHDMENEQEHPEIKKEQGPD